LHMRPIHWDMHGPEEKSVGWEGTLHTRARAHGRQWSPWQDATNLRWTGVVYTRVPVDVAMMFIHNALFSCPLLNQSWRPRRTSRPLTPHLICSYPPEIFIGVLDKQCKPATRKETTPADNLMRTETYED